MALLEQVIQRGLRAAQPAANTVAAGTLYGVEDEGDIVERSNGAAWESYSPAASSGDLVSSTNVITDNRVVRGDGGVRGVQESPVAIDDAGNVTGATSLAVGVALQANSKTTLGGTYVSPEVADGNSGVAKTLDLSAGNEHTLTLTGNCTLTLSNPTNMGRYVIIVSSGAGNFTLTWPANVSWGTAGTPTMTVTAGKYDIYTLIYYSGPDKFFGSYLQGC